MSVAESQSMGLHPSEDFGGVAVVDEVDEVDEVDREG